MNLMKRRDSLELTVLNSIARLGVARYADLCTELPFARASLSTALKRLRLKRMIAVERDSQGEYWVADVTDPAVYDDDRLLETGSSTPPAEIQPTGAISTPWSILQAWRTGPRLPHRS